MPDGDLVDGNSVIVDRWNPMIGWAIVGDLERIDVNGITGWKQDRGPGSTVIWQVSDLTWAMIGGAMDVDAAVDLARAVEFTDRATWEARYDVELGTYPTRRTSNSHAPRRPPHRPWWHSSSTTVACDSDRHRAADRLSRATSIPPIDDDRRFDDGLSRRDTR